MSIGLLFLCFSGSDLVEAAGYDVTAPIINSLTVQTATVHKPGSARLSFDVTEEGTGIVGFTCMLYTYNSGRLKTILYAGDYSAAPKYNGSFTFNIPIPETQFPSNYFVDDIRITDQAGNTRQYFNNFSKTGYSNDGTNNYLPCASDSSVKCIMNGTCMVTIEMNPGDDIVVPIINSITVQTPTIQKPGTVTLIFDVTEEGTGVVGIMGYLYTFRNDELVSIPFGESFLSSPRLSGQISVDIPVSSTQYAGNYYVNLIQINDGVDNDRSYYNIWNKEGYLNDGTNKYIPCADDETVKCIINGTGMINIQGNPTDDLLAPTINSITVQSNTVQKPGFINLSLDVTENGSGITDLQIFLYANIGDPLPLIAAAESYVDSPKFSGTLDISIPVATSEAVGTYKISWIRITDQFGNERNYSSASGQPYCNDGINDYLSCSSASNCIINSPSQIEIINEFDVEFEMAISNPSLISSLESLNEGKTAMILVDSSANDICPKAVFDAIRGKNVTVILNHNEYQWIFNGNTITEETKDINLKITTQYSDGSEYGLENKVLTVIFYPNGILPGVANVRLKSDYLYQIHGLTSTMYLYFLQDNNNLNLESDNVNYVLDGTDHWCSFNVTHNSTYVVSGSEIVPQKPTGLSVVSRGYNSNKITWNAVIGASSYVVYRSTIKDSGFKQIATPATASYISTGLTTGTMYYYKIKSCMLVDTNKVYSAATAAAGAKPIPNSPTNVKAASSGYNSNKITWTAITGATGYTVYRSTTAASGFVRIAETAATGYADNGLTTGKMYYYKIKTYTVLGSSKIYSSASAAAGARPIPSVPTMISALRVSPASINISCKAVPGATGYAVYRSLTPSGGFTQIAATALPSYTNTGLNTGTVYYYKIKAFRQVGTIKVFGAASASVWAKT